METKCPDSPVYAPGVATVFLAGGITGCPDWQADVALWVHPQIEWINPRRDGFDVTNSALSVEQIAWERKYLVESDAVMFWFPEETVCPIALYELGGRVEAGTQAIFVGCHPQYPRKFDVVEQLKLVDVNIEVANSIDSLASQVLLWVEQ